VAGRGVRAGKNQGFTSSMVIFDGLYKNRVHLVAEIRAEFF
jgi:hypothetical protein